VAGIGDDDEAGANDACAQCLRRERGTVASRSPTTISVGQRTTASGHARRSARARGGRPHSWRVRGAQARHRAFVEIALLTLREEAHATWAATTGIGAMVTSASRTSTRSARVGRRVAVAQTR